MLFISAFAALLLALSAEAKVGFSEQQPCCQTEQCVLFDPVCEAEDYEVRHYEPVKCAMTIMEFVSIDEAVATGSSRLHKYMEGSNEDGATIDLAQPLFVMVNHSVPGEPESYLLLLPLPAEHQENPPKSTDEKVFIHTPSDVNAYVRTMDHATAAETFARDLDSVGAKYRPGFHVIAIYRGRSGCEDAYEVMLLSVGDPVCVSGAK